MSKIVQLYTFVTNDPIEFISWASNSSLLQPAHDLFEDGTLP